MKVVIGGGSGFLGSLLVDAFRADRHEVLVLSRRPRQSGDVAWEQVATAVDGADVVVNLAGDPLDAGRWTAARKRSILDSRVRTTTTIVEAIDRSTRPARVLLSASAVGIYGDRGSETLTEASSTGTDFLAQVCVAWEAAARTTAARVVLLRTGLVLNRSRGALPRMALPFRLFAGGPLGSGDQFVSWIHHEDWVRLVQWTVTRADISGPVNLTSPTPVTNREFARALGRALRRPSIMPAPAFALRIVLGEMANAMVLSGQRVLPDKAQRNGFEFRFTDLESTLRAITSRT